MEVTHIEPIPCAGDEVESLHGNFSDEEMEIARDEVESLHGNSSDEATGVTDDESLGESVCVYPLSAADIVCTSWFVSTPPTGGP